MKQIYFKKNFFLAFIFFVLGTISLVSQDIGKLEKEEIKEEVFSKYKVANTYPKKMQSINADKLGILPNRNPISVLVATPNKDEFDLFILPTMQSYSSDVNYTVTKNLGALTVEEMLEYDLVWTFNISKWQIGTGIFSPTEWSNKLGAYLDADGRVLECEFVQGFDAWGLGDGDYITENKSPFNQATDDADIDGTLGDIAIPDHPIMSGISSFETNYIYQDVTLKEDATLIASWSDGYPLCAINDKVVAFNASPVGAFPGGSIQPVLSGDAYKMIYNAIVYLSSTLASADAPAEVLNLTANPDDLGGLSVELSWTNPSVTVDGNILTSLTNINIYLNEEETPIATINNPTIGGDVTYTINNLQNGINKFTVVCENENGEGKPKFVCTYVGFDVPAAVTNLTLTVDGVNGVLNWTSPTTGLNNGVLDNSPITYKIIRLPDNVELSNNHSTTSFTDNSIPGIGLYSYKVISQNNIGEGGATISNSEVVGPSITPPYTMGFEEDEQYTVWTVVDANLDGTTWSRTTNSGVIYDGYAMRYGYSSQNDADDWLISPKISLEANQIYKIGISARQNSPTYSESFKLYIGTNNTTSSFTTELLSVGHEGEENVSTMYKTFDTIITVNSSGDYYFAIQATSVKDQFHLFVDDFEVMPLSGDDLAATIISGPISGMVGFECTLDVGVKNLGTNTVDNYTVNIIDNNNNVIATANQSVCPEISFGEQIVVPVKFTPTEAGNYLLRGEIVFSSDSNLDNNITTNEIPLNIVETSTDFTSILGNGSTYNKTLPMNFYYNISCSQVIYYANQINVPNGGIIKKLTYFSDFQYQMSGSDIKIWMANTDVNSLDTWIPEEEFTLVYDGTYNFPIGHSDVNFDITNDFLYTGGNLAIMVVKLDGQWTDNCTFLQTDDVNTDRICSRMYKSDSELFDWTQEGIPLKYYPNARIKFRVDLGKGSVAGVVKDALNNNPIEGALITIENGEENKTTTTNSNGEYLLEELNEGNYTIKAEKEGYQTKTNEIIVIADTEVTNNFNLQPSEYITLKGTVRPSDNTSSVIEGAEVTLLGNSTYNTITNPNGVFTLENVYNGSTYQLSIEKDGYYLYTRNIEISSSEVGIVDLGDIIIKLLECLPVEDLTANVLENTVTLTWVHDNSEEPLNTVITEGFEGNELPEGWEIITHNINQSSSWEIIGTMELSDGTIIIPHEGEKQINCYWDFDSQDEWLITPEFNVPLGATLTFWTHLTYGSTGGDHYYVKVSTDGGNNWDILWDASTENAIENFYDIPVILDLNDFVGLNIKIAWQAYAPEGLWYPWFLDDITIASDRETLSFNGKQILRKPTIISLNYKDNKYSKNGKKISKNNLKGFAYNVYRDNELIATTTDFTYYDSNLENGTYNYCIETIYGDNECTSDKVCVDATINVTEQCNPVKNLVVENIDNTNVIQLTWDYPDGYIDPHQNNLTWSGPYDYNSIGTGEASDFDVANRFEISDLINFVGWKLTKITFYPDEKLCDYSIRAWVGDNAENLVLDQPVLEVNLQSENVINVETDVIIEPNKEFWIGYRCNTTTGYPAGVDAGPAVTGKGDLIKFQGNWVNLTSMGFSYNFVIIGTIENEIGEKVNLKLQDDKIRHFNGTLSLNKNINHNKGTKGTRLLTGYKIYLEDEVIATLTDPAENTFTYNYEIAKDETVTFCVKAVYETCESESICKDVIINTGINDNKNIKIYPNPSKDIVNINGVIVDRVYIYNNVGKLVDILKNNQIDVSNYSLGVYIIKIIDINGNIFNTKIIVR